MFNHIFGFNSRATGCKHHVMYSALAKLTVVQVPSSFFAIRSKILIYSRTILARYPNFFPGRTFSLCTTSARHPSTSFNAFFRRSRSLSKRKFFRASRPFIYIRTSKNTPLLTGSIIHISSSALKCHSPGRDFQWYRSIMPACVKPRPTVVVIVMVVSIPLVAAMVIVVCV